MLTKAIGTKTLVEVKIVAASMDSDLEACRAGNKQDQKGETHKADGWWVRRMMMMMMMIPKQLSTTTTRVYMYE